MALFLFCGSGSGIVKVAEAVTVAIDSFQILQRAGRRLRGLSAGRIPQLPVCLHHLPAMDGIGHTYRSYRLLGLGQRVRHLHLNFGYRAQPDLQHRMARVA